MQSVFTSSILLSVVSGTTLAAPSLFNGYNLVVRNNVNSTSEVDGSALIGGNLNGASNYAVQGVTALNGAGLSVGGTVSNGPISINNGGNFRFGGSVNTLVNRNGGGSSTSVSTITSEVTAAFAQATSVSSFLSSLSANGTLDGAGNMNASPVLLDGRRIAVYNLSPSMWAGLGQLNLNFGSADSVIINVNTAPGATVSFSAPPNFVGGLNQANSSRILWNIPSAGVININNNFNGALLAPNAALNLLGGGLNGTVIVDSIPNQAAEIRRSVYTGFIPTPGSAALLALAGLTAARRRRAA
jgi:choice-of-anchor A domain-containing protein